MKSKLENTLMTLRFSIKLVCLFLLVLPFSNYAQVERVTNLVYELDNRTVSNTFRVIEPLEINDSIIIVLKNKEEEIEVILTKFIQNTSKIIYKSGKVNVVKVVSLRKESDSLVSWIEKEENFSHLVYFNIYTNEIKKVLLDFKLVDFKVAKSLNNKGFAVLSFNEDSVTLGVYDLEKKKVIIQKKILLLGAFLHNLEQVKLYALGNDKVVIADGTNFKLTLLDSNLKTLDVWEKPPQYWKQNEGYELFKKQFLSMKKDSMFKSYLKYSSLECLEFISDTSFMSVWHVPGYIGSVLRAHMWHISSGTINYSRMYDFPNARKTSLWKPQYGPIGNYFYDYYRIVENGIFHGVVWGNQQQVWLSHKEMKHEDLFRPFTISKKFVFIDKKVRIDFGRWRSD